jgi:hypothetical protein
MGKRYLVPRGILWIMCAYHLVVGVALNCPTEWVIWVAEHWFSIRQLPGASSIHIARMLGVYMVAFGVALGTAAWDPIKNRAILTIGVILAVTRCVQRLATSAQLEEALGIPQSHNIALFAPLIVFSIVLIVFRWHIYRKMHTGGTPPA